MYRLFDTHAHLEQLENLGDALARARDAGVTGIIGVGMDYDSNRKILEIADEYPGMVFPALGWHPWGISSAEMDRSLAFIEENMDRAVAVGEIGLDYHKRVRERADKELQKDVLKKLLGIARRHDKPALVHSRYAWRDALDAVLECGVTKAVFHWYTGPSSVLRDILINGFHLSATPSVEYHEEHRRAVKEAPAERLLLETDAPVVYGRGRDIEFTSMPADVRRSLDGASLLKGIDGVKLAETTTRNALDLFNLG